MTCREAEQLGCPGSGRGGPCANKPVYPLASPLELGYKDLWATGTLSMLF
jgi:hypothetical protein